MDLWPKSPMICTVVVTHPKSYSATIRGSYKPYTIATCIYLPTRPSSAPTLPLFLVGSGVLAPTAQKKMVSLPKDRIKPSKPPFTYTGVDCFGPFEVRHGRTKVKWYDVIFTCLALHAVHIEAASSLNTSPLSVHCADSSQGQYLAHIFWLRWVREYLPSLQQWQK